MTIHAKHSVKFFFVLLVNHNALRFLSFFFSFWDFENVNWYFSFENLTDRSGKFSSFQDIYIKIDASGDLFISIRRMATKFGKEMDLEELTHL